jgi:hypothetical protein
VEEPPEDALHISLDFFLQGICCKEMMVLFTKREDSTHKRFCKSWRDETDRSLIVTLIFVPAIFR